MSNQQNQQTDGKWQEMKTRGASVLVPRKWKAPTFQDTNVSF